MPKRVWLVSGAVLLVSLLTVTSVPLFDPDEGYYPATAVESVDAGHGWDPRFNGEPRWDKPILSYVLIETSFALFGRSIAAARLPSAIQGALLTLLIGGLVARLTTPRAGTLAAAVVSTTTGVQIFARAAHPEIGVVLGITVAQVLIPVWIATSGRQHRAWIAAAIGVAIGYGALAKGPVAIVLPGATAIAAVLILRTHRDTLLVARDATIASATAAIVVTPWYALMTQRHGMMFLHEALWRQNVGRYAGEAFGHEARPIWFFILPTLIAMLPWSAFLPAALRRLMPSDNSPREVLRTTMAVAAAVGFLFYSASASKLPHYVVVLTPPLGVLIALYLDETLEDDGKRSFDMTAILLAMVGAALAMTPFLVHRMFTARELLGGVAGDVETLQWSLAWAVAPFALLSVAAAVGVWRLRSHARVVVLIAAGMLGPAALIAGAGPLFQDVYPWERFGTTIRQTNQPVWLIGPRSPSLTFHAGRPVMRLTGSQVAERIGTPAAVWLIADASEIEAIRRHPPGTPLTVDVVDRVGSMVLAQVVSRSGESGQPVRK